MAGLVVATLALYLFLHWITGGDWMTMVPWMLGGLWLFGMYKFFRISNRTSEPVVDRDNLEKEE